MHFHQLILLALCATPLLLVDGQSSKVDASVQKLPNPPERAPASLKESGADLSGQKGGKAAINANFAGLPGAKNPAGRSPQKAQVNRDGSGGASGSGGGVDVLAKKTGGSGVAYGAKGVSGSNTSPGGTGNLVKGKGGDAHFNGKAQRDSKADWSKDSQGQSNVNLVGGKQSGVAKGLGADGKDKFEFTDASAKNDFIVDPTKQTANKEVVGKINAKTAKGKVDGPYDFDVDTPGKLPKGQAGANTAELKSSNSAAGRSGFNWKCTGDNIGLSDCKSADGKTAGKSNVDDQGNSIVYGPNGNVVGRGSVKKDAAKTYNVNVGQTAKGTGKADDGLYLASVKNWQTADCYKEVAKKDNPLKEQIKLQSPYKFVYNQDGTNQYRFPDCFKIVGKVYIPKGVDVKTLAIEFQATINPLGNMKCADPGACGRTCYYCDICKSQSIRWKLASTNTDSGDTCSRVGQGDWYEMGATVCPPPDSKMAVCSSFDRSYSSDFLLKKQDSVVVNLLFWKRPAKQTDLENNFFYRLKTEGDKFRQSIKTTSQAKGLLAGKGLTDQLSDFELKESYVREQLIALNGDYKEELLFCNRATADYDLAGSKVGGQFLVTASDTLKNKGNVTASVYSQPVCPDVAKLQADEIAAMKAKWVADKEPKGSNGNPLSALGGLFGR